MSGMGTGKGGGNTGEGRTAWIISYTPVCKEPRVIRQASALREAGWRVVVFGMPGPSACPEWWHHVPLPESAARQRAAWRPVRLAQIALDRHLMRVRHAGMLIARSPAPAPVRQLGARIHERLVEGFECKRQAIRSYAATRPDMAPDLVLCHDYFTADIAWWVARRFHAKMAVDCHEYAPGQYVQDPHWVRWHQPRVVALQAYYLGRADAVTTVCEGIAGLLDAEYRLKRPVRVVRSTPFYSKQEFRPTGERITVMYHGEIYASRGLHFAVRSLPLWRPEFRLVLRGYSDPAYVEELWRLARELGVEDRLAIEPPVPFHEIVPAANRADIGYFVHQDISPQRKFVLPNKFFEYVMAGLALSVSDLPEMARLVRRYDLGVMVRDIDPQSIAAAINSLDRERIDACKRHSLEAARVLNWEAEGREMMSLYEELFQ